MILLPPARLATLKSFGLLLALAMGTTVGVVPSVSGGYAAVLLGVMTFLILIIPILLRPQLIALPYRLWARLARETACWASTLLTGICFYLIFFAVKQAGVKLDLNCPTSTQSLWTSRGTLPQASYGQQHRGTRQSSSGRWLPTFLLWSLQSGNLWAACLSPFLLVLAGLEEEQEESVRTDLYTLF